MGNGIAQVAATAGLNVIMSDIKIEFVPRGLATITRILGKRRGQGQDQRRGDKDAILGRIKITADLKDMADADFVVEAATENETSSSNFSNLDEICPAGVILSTNTSSIPIGRIAAQTGRPDKVIGMHFMNPVPVMKLVEVIRGLATSDETFKTTWDLSEKFGKTPALRPMISRLYRQPHPDAHDQRGGVLPLPWRGHPEDIDTVMKLGMNHPMGPLALADLIGLDTCLAIMETLYDGFKDSKYRPLPPAEKVCGSRLAGQENRQRVLRKKDRATAPGGKEN
jgi:3-hydroxybutyryl-CoA dehydrogenase